MVQISITRAKLSPLVGDLIFSKAAGFVLIIISSESCASYIFHAH